MKKIFKWRGVALRTIKNMPPDNRRKLAVALDGLEDILVEIRKDFDI